MFGKQDSCGFLACLTGEEKRKDVIYPDEPMLEYEKWGRGRPSKKKLEERKKYNDLIKKIRYKYTLRNH